MKTKETEFFFGHYLLDIFTYLVLLGILYKFERLHTRRLDGYIANVTDNESCQIAEVIIQAENSNQASARIPYAYLQNVGITIDKNYFTTRIVFILFGSLLTSVSLLFSIS